MSAAELQYHGAQSESLSAYPQPALTNQQESYFGQAPSTVMINVTQPQQKTITPPPPDYSIDWGTMFLVLIIVGPLPTLIFIIMVCFINHFGSKAKKQYARGNHEAAYRSSHTAAAIRACMLCCTAPLITVLPIVIVLVFAVRGINQR